MIQNDEPPLRASHKMFFEVGLETQCVFCQVPHSCCINKQHNMGTVDTPPKFKINTKNDDLAKLVSIILILNLRGTKNPGPSKLASFWGPKSIPAKYSFVHPSIRGGPMILWSFISWNEWSLKHPETRQESHSWKVYHSHRIRVCMVYDPT